MTRLVAHASRRFARYGTAGRVDQTRREMVMWSTMGIRAAGFAVLALGLAVAAPASAQDVVRDGLQRGALGALKVTLPLVQDKYKLKYEVKTFNDSTAVILAMEQKELEMGNLTAQHVVRAIDEGMNLVVVIGWGGGYNVLFGGKDMPLAKDDLAGLKKLVDARKAA